MERDQRSDEPATTTFNILFVCTGNTCRSPMAEALGREELARRGWSHVRVASAGVAAEPGHGASPHAITVMRQRGIDLSPHQSRPLTPELVDWADLVLAMSPSHLGPIAGHGGETRMALLEEFATGEEGTGRGIPDPYGSDEWEYERTRQALEALIRQSLDRLAPILRP